MLALRPSAGSFRQLMRPPTGGRVLADSGGEERGEPECCRSLFAAMQQVVGSQTHGRFAPAGTGVAFSADNKSAAGGL